MAARGRAMEMKLTNLNNKIDQKHINCDATVARRNDQDVINACEI